VGKLHEALLAKRKRAAWHGSDQHSMWNREDTWAPKHLTETAKRIEDLMQQTGAEVVVVGGPSSSRCSANPCSRGSQDDSLSAPATVVATQRRPLACGSRTVGSLFCFQSRDCAMAERDQCVRPREYASGAGSPNAWQAKV
jgi:lysozyme family protein